MLIKKSALNFILGVSRRVYPKEFTGLLRGGPEIIEEVLLIPGSLFGDNFSSIRTDMTPIDSSIIGSVHSHPSKSYHPSDTDLRFFGSMGFVHMILRHPYRDISDIAVYDINGNKIQLQVVD